LSKSIILLKQKRKHEILVFSLGRALKSNVFHLSDLKTTNQKKLYERGIHK